MVSGAESKLYKDEDAEEIARDYGFKLDSHGVIFDIVPPFTIYYLEGQDAVESFRNHGISDRDAEDMDILKQNLYETDFHLKTEMENYVDAIESHIEYFEILREKDAKIILGEKPDYPFNELSEKIDSFCVKYEKLREKEGWEITDCDSELFFNKYNSNGRFWVVERNDETNILQSDEPAYILAKRLGLVLGEYGEILDIEEIDPSLEERLKETAIPLDKYQIERLKQGVDLIKRSLGVLEKLRSERTP